jgi:hypothetical protein
MRIKRSLELAVWYIPIIPATQEMEVRECWSKDDNPNKKCKTLSKTK